MVGVTTFYCEDYCYKLNVDVTKLLSSKKTVDPRFAPSDGFPSSASSNDRNAPQKKNVATTPNHNRVVLGDVYGQERLSERRRLANRYEPDAPTGSSARARVDENAYEGFDVTQNGNMVYQTPASRKDMGNICNAPKKPMQSRKRFPDRDACEEELLPKKLNFEDLEPVELEHAELEHAEQPWTF
uniref:Uncharacterized protein n=1 Tax=Panagrolaimus superbus TaxID=310955 RepID=A0A914Z4I6_9BILA